MIADDATLSRLMAAAQKGDKAAYNLLLSEVSIWLERYFRRRLPPSQVDDLVQDVLLALHAKRASYDPRRAFLPWLAAIARYRWVDHLRSVYKHQSQMLADGDGPVEGEEEVIAARVSLERLFSLLPRRQAKVIELVKIKGFSISEAAQASGQSESLVKVNIHRGLKKLARHVEEAD